MTLLSTKEKGNTEFRYNKLFKITFYSASCGLLRAEYDLLQYTFPSVYLLVSMVDNNSDNAIHLLQMGVTNISHTTTYHHYRFSLLNHDSRIYVNVFVK